MQYQWKKWRDFLFSSGRSHDMFVFLFFLAISAGFWLLQTLDETFETEISVPLRLTDVPEDVVITTSLPEVLHVVVRDKGTALLRYWRHSVQPVEVSFADYNTGAASGRVGLPQNEVLKAVQEQLSASTRIQTLRPDTLEFFYNHGMNASVPVRIMGEVKTDTRFYLYDVKAEPAEVNVFAPASILDTLTAVYTKPLSLSKLKENTTVETELKPMRGAHFEPKRVKVTAQVDFYIEQSVDIPVVSLNFPGDRELRTFPASVRVTYTVGYQHSRDIKAENFLFLVTYDEILALRGQHIAKIPVQLKSIPEGVSNVHTEPEELDFLIETLAED